MSRDFPEWKAKEVDFCTLNKIPLNKKAWSGRREVRLHGLSRTCTRQVNMLDHVLAAQVRLHPDWSIEKILEDLWCNIAENIHRGGSQGPIHRGCPGTLTTKNLWYNYKHDTVLPGMCQLQLMGWPRRYCVGQGYSDPELRELSGQSFSVPIACMLDYVQWANPWAAWWKAAD